MKIEPAAQAPPKSAVGYFLLLATVVFFGYAIAHAAATSLFLQAHGSDALPLVYVAVAATSVAVVGALTWASRRFTQRAIYLTTCLVSAGLFAALLGAQARGMYGAAFALYVVKDVYIALLSELFWTLANSVYPQQRAHRLYGLFCVAGSLGSIVGSLAISALAHRWGTLACFWTLVPLCLLAAVCAQLCAARLPAVPAPAKGHKPAWGAWAVVRRSRVLPAMLALVAVVQLTITVTDFQFNAVMQSTYANVDARTHVLGVVGTIINTLSMLLQLCTAPLVRLLGAGGLLLAIPVVMVGSSAAYLAVPGFYSVAALKILGKSFDYSLFRAVKEFFYLPLSYREKTEGKALIDMLTYRLAKGLASALLWAVALYQLHACLSALLLALSGLWLLATTVLWRRQRATEAAA